MEAKNWQAVHVGFEGDQLEIGGVKVWKEKWRSLDLKPISLPHPAYPNQRHRFYVYEVGDPQAPVRFASGELSNGVWGFYIPA
jgi:hypothetical protein